ncbi:dipeptidase [Peribacillus loiseleuriae]|uniref:dipeptidase n=1 Tax=Peribacillus loiseleuriae TaxID=1679170 RepID=UPI003CFC0258
MKIFDAHCDVLMKMFIDATITFHDQSKLDITYESLKETGGKVQCFAIYIPENVHPDLRFMAALSMVELFVTKIVLLPQIRWIRTKEDIQKLKVDQIGAVLTLEGCDCIGADILKLKTLLRLGVRSVGLTWNFANMVADGAMEQRGAGVTRFGEHVIEVLNENKAWTDVSHLSEQAFWDVIERANDIIASHSNAYKLCPHRRNLRDDQISALINKGAPIGITFVPEFLKKDKKATIKDVLEHIDYIGSLGGRNNLGFGSDFDGIDHKVSGLTNYRGYQELINSLTKYYSADFVKDLLFNNFAKKFPNDSQLVNESY